MIKGIGYLLIGASIMITLIAYIISSNVTYVHATVYQPTVEQTNNNPDITASGSVIDLNDPLSHKWIAVSRDLEEIGFTFGTKVRVYGTGQYDGVWTIQDRMNKRWTKRIDFLIGINDPIGVWENVSIKIIN